jgi:hypothetical protein
VPSLGNDRCARESIASSHVASANATRVASSHLPSAKPTRVSVTSRVASSHLASAATRRVSWISEHDRQVVIRSE